MTQTHPITPPPEPVAPTDEELLASVRHFYGDQAAADMGAEDDLRTARAVIARWGRPTPQPPAELAEMVKRLHEINSPTPQPVAVSERWPEFSECNPFEAVWAFNPVLDHWKLTRINQTLHTHWLPHWALPVPGVEGADE